MAIDIKKFVNRFIEEARDHLNRLAEGLTALETGRADAEHINAIFRSAHTIKGSSRMLKLLPVTDTAHKLEDVMGALRDGSVVYTPAMGSCCFARSTPCRHSLIAWPTPRTRRNCPRLMPACARRWRKRQPVRRRCLHPNPGPR